MLGRFDYDNKEYLKILFSHYNVEWKLKENNSST